MALIRKSQSAVTDLVAALAALTAADATELARAQAAEAALTTALAAEEAARIAADNTLTADLAAEVARATNAETTLQTNITAEETARIAAVAAENTRALAAEAALGTRIDNVLENTDGAALDSLVEVVNAFQAADSTLNGAITALAASAGSGLDDEIARATAAETALQAAIDAEAAARAAADTTLQANIDAEAAARAAADTALDAALKAYADEAVRVGGAVDAIESLIVTANKIVLTNAPKHGAASIMNFARVSYVDANDNEFLYPVSIDATDTSGKTFIVAVDTSGELDTKSVFVQYSYVAAA